MDCPLLSGNRSKQCRSTRDLLAHTLFSEDNRYCRGIWFTLCPLYRQHYLSVFLSSDVSARVVMEPVCVNDASRTVR